MAVKTARMDFWGLWFRTVLLVPLDLYESC